MKWDKKTEMFGFSNVETITSDLGVVAIIGAGKSQLSKEQSISNPQYLYDIDLLIKLLKRLQKRGTRGVTLYTAEHAEDPVIPLLIFREGFTIGVLAPRCPIDEAP
ncbi:hypothetical protein EOM86_14695 [Candidatus Nomurabacteria bacterium]|nr:hypothetical protein [Candidatus Nomurabacteria bacterium]